VKEWRASRVSLVQRSADNARRLMTQLASRIHFPKPHDADAHGYRAGGYVPIIQISTDAFPACTAKR
jgi:hypothetical protein